MLQSGWLIVHLIAGAMAASGSASAGPPRGVSCTYQACMAKCGGLKRPICHSYCETRIAQRIAGGVCTSQEIDPKTDQHAAGVGEFILGN